MAAQQSAQHFMLRWLVPLLLAVILVLLFIVQHAFSKPEPAAPIAPAAQDQRAPVALTPEQGGFVLGQMRMLMAALRDLHAAEVKGDWAEMARLADAMGPGKHKNPKGLKEAQPEAFSAMSKAMRGDFAAMAKAATARDKAQFDAHLSAAMDKCVACHEGYKLVAAGK